MAGNKPDDKLPDTEQDTRPLFAIGHTFMEVNDVPQAHDFFVRHGMREILRRDKLGILELRGGTHLILPPADVPVDEGKLAPFDLMVDDVDSVHQQFADDGVQASEIERGDIHDSFRIAGPSGYSIVVNSSHVLGVV